MHSKLIEIPAFFAPDGIGEIVDTGVFELVDNEGNPTITSFSGNGLCGRLAVDVSGTRTSVYLPTTEQYGSGVLWRLSIGAQSRLFDFPGYAVLCDQGGIPIGSSDGKILAVSYNDTLSLLDLLAGIDMSILATIAHHIPMSVADLQGKLDEITTAAKQADVVDLGNGTNVTIALREDRPVARKVHLTGNGALTLTPLAGADQASYALLVITSANPAFELMAPANLEWVDAPMQLKPQAGHKIILGIEQLFGSMYASAFAMTIPGG